MWCGNYMMCLIQVGRPPMQSQHSDSEDSEVLDVLGVVGKWKTIWYIQKYSKCDLYAWYLTDRLIVLSKCFKN